MRVSRSLMRMLVVSCLVVACSKKENPPNPEPSVAVTIKSDDNLAQLELPVGALPEESKSAVVTVRRLTGASIPIVPTSSNSAARTVAYELLPDGLVLQKPAILTLEAPGATGPTIAIPSAYHVRSDGTVERPATIASLDATDGHLDVIVALKHFSTVVVNADGSIKVTLATASDHNVGDAFIQASEIEQVRGERVMRLNRDTPYGRAGDTVKLRSKMPWVVGGCMKTLGVVSPILVLDVPRPQRIEAGGESEIDTHGAFLCASPGAAIITHYVAAHTTEEIVYGPSGHEQTSTLLLPSTLDAPDDFYAALARTSGFFVDDRTPPPTRDNAPAELYAQYVAFVNNLPRSAVLRVSTNPFRCVEAPVHDDAGIRDARVDAGDTADAANTGDSGPLCPNGRVDPGENCDPPTVSPTCTQRYNGYCDGTCHWTVQTPGCGDNCITTGEECDGTAQPQCAQGQECVGCRCRNKCGNQSIDSGEDCDPPTASPTCQQRYNGYCDSTCHNAIATPSCGDNCITTGEECDGTAQPQCAQGQECHQCHCRMLCGNGRVDQGEACDGSSGNWNCTNGQGQPSTCTNQCTCV